ncbi:MAG: hypothetical protein ACYC61_14065 [Isosphaeraceae bacterium]
MPGAEHDVSGDPVPSQLDAEAGRPAGEDRGGEPAISSNLEDHLPELIDAAEHLAGDPVAAWGAIRAELERRIARQSQGGSSAIAEPTSSGVEPGSGDQRTGGAMSTGLDAQTQPRRPFVGFDREAATYARRKPDLLSRYPGQFVVIVGDEVEGPFESFREALRSGYRRFGLGPLFVKQILAVEPVVEVTRNVMPCRS